MAKKEFKIGEEFQCGLIRLRCEETRNIGACCEGCFFNYRCFKAVTGKITGPCARTHREDKTDVVFIKVD